MTPLLATLAALAFCALSRAYLNSRERIARRKQRYFATHDHDALTLPKKYRYRSRLRHGQDGSVIAEILLVIVGTATLYATAWLLFSFNPHW